MTDISAIGPKELIGIKYERKFHFSHCCSAHAQSKVKLYWHIGGLLL